MTFLKPKVLTDEAIAEEEARFEEINQGFNALLMELNLSREQLRSFVNNPDNFTEADWTEMTSIRASLEQKLADKLAKIPKGSPEYARRSLSIVQPSWIFVR